MLNKWQRDLDRPNISPRARADKTGLILSSMIHKQKNGLSYGAQERWGKDCMQSEMPVFVTRHQGWSTSWLLPLPFSLPPTLPWWKSREPHHQLLQQFQYQFGLKSCYLQTTYDQQSQKSHSGRSYELPHTWLLNGTNHPPHICGIIAMRQKAATHYFPLNVVETQLHAAMTQQMHKHSEANLAVNYSPITSWADLKFLIVEYHDTFIWGKIVRNNDLPNTIIENPMTNTRFRTFPTAWVRGATLSSVLFASCSFSPHKIIKKQSTNVEHCFVFLPIFKDIYTDLKMKWLLLI